MFLEFIIDLVKKGDIITIECGNEKITGKILKLDNQLIAIQSEGKMVIRKDDAITNIEVKDADSHQSMTDEKKSEKIVENESSAANTSNLSSTSSVEDNESSDAKPVDTIQPSIVLEDVIKKNLEQWQTEQKVKKSKREKLTSLGGDFGVLEELVAEDHKIDNQKYVSARGKVIFLSETYGFISDEQTEERIYFRPSQLISPRLKETCLPETPVVYSVEQGEVSLVALGIHEPGTIQDLIKLATGLIKEGNKKKASYVVDHILQDYPSNLAADRLKEELTRKRVSTIKSFVSTKQNERPTEQKQQVIPIDLETNQKPAILLDGLDKSLLPNKTKKILSEIESRNIEKELDTLIRQGEREECLAQSYKVLQTSSPTSKYVKSFLDRMVNTEIALDNYEAASKCISQLIWYNEQDPSTKPNTQAHLYLTLARILGQLSMKEDALKAVFCAESLRPGNVAIENAKRQILFLIDSRVEGNQTDGEKNTEHVDGMSFVVSRMLQQDIEEHAASLELEEHDTSSKLFARAEECSKDKTLTFYDRAQNYLKAAACMLVNKEKGRNYASSIAGYARMKGNAMYAKISQDMLKYPDSKDSLIACCDSAKSYYIEALDIYSDLGQSRYLQDLLLKSLKIERVLSQIDGGKTPDADWASGTLNEKLRECLAEDSVEEQKAFYRTCISIGSSAEHAWNKLSKDPDGTGPLYGKLSSQEFRKTAYAIFNEIERSNTDVFLQPSDFLKKIFEHRHSRIERLNNLLQQCIDWEFDSFAIRNFADEWRPIISEYGDLFSYTDKQLQANIDLVIKLFSNYQDVGEDERNSKLNNALSKMTKNLGLIASTTTYYGRVFFYPISTKWQKAIQQNLNERIAKEDPKFRVKTDPSVIKKDENGRFVNFVVTNYGKSTAEGCIVEISAHGYSDTIPVDESISVKASKELVWNLPQELQNVSVLEVSFDVTPLYLGHKLAKAHFEATYEEDSNQPIDFSQAPWDVSSDRSDDKSMGKVKLFFGREEKLDLLKRHYLSPERITTYILYGLTRTGKTSILTHLRQQIDGRSLLENNDYIIRAFEWDFSVTNFTRDEESTFWVRLVNDGILKKLSSKERKIIEETIGVEKFNLDGIINVNQNDFLHLIDALNFAKIMPLITIDEFSNVKQRMDNGMLNSSFLSILRDLSLQRKACFVYAGTYDIKYLPTDEKYGLTGQLTNTCSMKINEIDEACADQLIDAWPEVLHFTDEAKRHIRNLSGCVPYWIQWICRNCAQYAAKYQRHWIGFHEVDEVVRIMAGETIPAVSVGFVSLDIANFQNNQYNPGAEYENVVISSIAYINRDAKRYGRGASIEELRSLWTKFRVPTSQISNLISALDELEERQILTPYEDEDRTMYKLTVDLFRRCWYQNRTQDIDKILTKLI